MLTDQIISITDLRQNASKIIADVGHQDRIVVVHNKPKAAIISIEAYEFLKKISGWPPEALENALFLANNKSLDFLKDEPDLYEEY